MKGCRSDTDPLISDRLKQTHPAIADILKTNKALAVLSIAGDGGLN